MNARHDPELDDVLQDEELRRLAGLLTSTQRQEPPIDDAFRSGLRRQLMQQAWEMGEGRPSLWRRVFAPPGLAWVGATAGLVLIAGIVVLNSMQQPVPFQQLFVQSPMDGSRAVALAQPILVNFNQPMDHPSTEAAVQITPATNVTYSWSSNTLAVQPASGILAPNTQYQVTIGSGAKTASGQSLSTAQTITFVTQPPAPATPSPTPRAPATPSSLLTGEHQLAPLGGSLTISEVQWSADASTVYFVNSKGALSAVPAKGGDVSIVAPDGVSSPAIAPAGDRLAYIRGSKIEVLTFATGTTAELAVTTAPTVVGWAKDKLVWSAADGIYTQGAGGPARLAPLPTTGAIKVLSLAPDGTHAVYLADLNLFLLDLTSAKSAQLGQANAAFFGWSPSGSQVMYSGTAGNIAISDVQGNSVGTVPAGDASWSSQDAILLGSETDLYQAHPDGSNTTKLANGTYRLPMWAPNATAFTFFRGGVLWTASAPALPPLPSVLDEASAAVNMFMLARQKGQADQANALLDSNGKQAYATGGLNLVVTGDPSFSRFYILTQAVTGTQPDTATFVVRLVLTHGKLDVADYEETLTVVRDATTRQFLIDQAVAGAHRDLGKGAEVVAVVVAANSIQLTFDSDLDPGTVADALHVLDSKGRQLDATTTYSNRTVTIGGLDLKPGTQYKLVVLTTLRDFLGHNIAAEYDLQLVGPVAKNKAANKNGGVTAPVPVSPSPSPGPSSTPS
jgi:Bacterial Ig-like domain